MPATKVTFLALLALLLCGCRVGNRPTSEATPHDTVDSGTAPDAERHNRFDPSAVAVGDSVLGLRIAALEVQASLVDSDGWVGMVQFEGTRVLSGAYRRHPFDADLEELCFFPDAGSATRLPVFTNDERTSWLCFTNQEEARAMFNHPHGRAMATIEVDRYLYHYSHSDVYNTARLLRVITYEDSLSAHEWVLLSLRGEPVIPGTRVTLTVSPEHVGGYAGCNWYGGEYVVRGDTLRIEEVSMTARLCERPQGVMAQENAYVDLLDEDGLYRITGDTLRLESDDGETLLTFRRRQRQAMDPTNLIGSQWTLQRFTSRRLVPSSHITLSFNEDRVRGFAGCRNYTGRYRAEGDEISISELAMREIDCPDDRYLEQEGEYTTALGEASHYLLRGDHLELYTVGGDTLVFETHQR